MPTKCEVAGFIYCENIKEFVFKNRDKLKFGNPLVFGETDVLYHWIRRPNIISLMYNFGGAVTAEIG